MGGRKRDLAAGTTHIMIDAMHCGAEGAGVPIHGECECVCVRAGVGGGVWGWLRGGGDGGGREGHVRAPSLHLQEQYVVELQGLVRGCHHGVPIIQALQ